MKVGIIGLPGTGKTSLYNALTRSQVNLSQYDSKDVHIGVISVPDPRFDYSVEQCSPKKVTPATIEFTEGGARIEREEHHGHGAKFGADFFAGVRNVEALILVTRAFQSELMPDPPDGINPVREAERTMEELLLADLTVVEGRLERLEKARMLKRQSTAEAVEHQTLDRIKTHLESLQPVRTLSLSVDEERSIRSYAFVSGKPLILVVNINESDAGSQNLDILKEPTDFARSQNAPIVAICASTEMEVAQMDPAEELEFLQALGIQESARDRLIRAAYAALGLLSFFTVGDDEVRAWTITAGSNAVEAAEKIHSDLARGFIRAEVISFEEFKSAGGCWDEARAAGKMHLEGKEYVVQDGDILHVRFKV